MVRPNSTFWGFILVAYSLMLNWISLDNLLYTGIYYGSLVLISGLFTAKGQAIDLVGNTPHSNTKRNVLILVAFLLLVVGAFYFFG